MRRSTTLATIAALALLLAPSLARAEFGFLPGAEGFSVTPLEADGSVAERAGSHPFAVRTEIAFNLAGESPDVPGAFFTDGDLRNLRIDLPPGFVENPNAIPQCTQARFHAPRISPFEDSLSGESCPDETQIGVVEIESSAGGGSTRSFGVFNLAPPPGFPSQFGFSPYGTPVAITPQIRETGEEYGLTLDLRNYPQQLDTYRLELTIWGVPWNAAHDVERGDCLNEANREEPHGKCPVGDVKLNPHTAYLTLPSNCDARLAFKASATSWQQPGTAHAVSKSADTLVDCETMPFNPAPRALLNTDRAGSPSGFDFTLDGSAVGLLDPERRASSQVKKAVLELPVGMTINPSLGAGLGVCTRAQYAAETVSSPPGAGCPNDSKIGELTVESPLFDGQVTGGLFLAQPDDPESPGAENPFNSMLALYMVAKAPDRGVMVRVAGRVDADPGSGQLVATFDDLPQLPYTHFNVHFRDGQRTPLATPSACGDYTVRTSLSPWLDPRQVHGHNSVLAIDTGIGGGPCPNGTVPPFNPRATAGTLNRNAGSYTPFYLRLTRTDAEQEITSYSAVMPPGLTGKLKGIPYCPEAAIAAARVRSGFAEQRDPSCPDASRIGRTYSGYGLSSVLAYAPGGLYLAGPYRGASFSIVAVNSATVGPFDLGTIIVRSAIRVDPRTARVSVDSIGSDPIPHIIKGIPIHLRDVRVYIDRPGLTLNPTNCEPLAAVSTLAGSGATFGSVADDTSASVTNPFQVSNCSALRFKPRVNFKLFGGTKRGDYPRFRAVVRPRPGDANIGRVAVTLPPSLFLAQENIETICTRPQFAADRCPAGSVYGYAKAVTPLLGQPLQGPVYLRSSDNPLPDLVADIAGNGIDIELVGKVDAVKGRLRGTFDVIPDAPVSKFTMSLRGGKRGVLANADNTCAVPMVASARMIGQNNVGARLQVPLVNRRCR